MSETQRSTTHHHNAQFHLRKFADDGRVWRHDRTGEHPAARKPPKTIGYEDFLYAPKDNGPDTTSDAWEQWLGRVDSDAAIALAKLEREEKLNNKERSHVAAYVAAQDMRTPRARDHLLAEYQRELDEWWANLDRGEIKRGIKERQGVEYDDQEIELYWEAYRPAPTNVAWLDLIRRNLHVAGSRLHGLPWTLLRIPPGHELLLNDVGIVKFRGSFATEPVPFTLGWSGDCHHWLMPLSPHVALTIAPDNKYWLGTGSPGWVEAVNRRLVLDAHRYVYSRGFESAVQQWWDEAATNEA